MHRNRATAGLLVALLLTAAPLARGAAPELSHVKIRAQDRSDGYALLYELAEDESAVDKILILKSASTNTTAMINEIAQNARKARQQLEAYAAADRHLRLGEKHLPLIEQKTRDDIGVATRNELLFSSGKNFELRLLFTQAQAMQYGAHLARVLRDHEDHSDRRDYLDAMAREWDELYRRVMGLLLAL